MRSIFFQEEVGVLWEQRWPLSSTALLTFQGQALVGRHHRGQQRHTLHLFSNPSDSFSIFFLKKRQIYGALSFAVATQVGKGWSIQLSSRVDVAHRQQGIRSFLLFKNALSIP